MEKKNKSHHNLCQVSLEKHLNWRRENNLKILRKYYSNYLKFAFIQEPDSDLHPRPLCVVCSDILSNDAMKPSKLADTSNQNTRITKNKKPYTIGEDLIKPCMSQAGEVVLRKRSIKKLKEIPMSANTIKRRIEEMADNIENQVIIMVKNLPFYYNTQ
ncbi:Hypothetical protein CINCED_3A003181 [Cinara cedri]|uniref:Uncharacterized protein n=1 Tax=Cinara cedri TaxID=506608 RepID=A0A5E4NQV7_9HEMI|nr:Hypothetical protein CINCED_3A003181 [Cinara cedri]